jgi:hypothetical protein
LLKADASAPSGYLLKTDAASTYATRTGGVLQVVNSFYSTQLNTTSTTPQDTGLSVTITPKSATSKIVVEVHQNGCYTLGGTGMALWLQKNGSNLAKLGGRIGGDGNATVYSVGSVSTSYMDSPGTTSPVTYKTQYFSESGTNVYVQSYSATSTITVWEIGV